MLTLFDKKYLHKVKTNITCYVLILALIGGLFAFLADVKVLAEGDKTGVVRVDTVMNVRVGAGTSYAQLMDESGKYIQLTNNYVVMVLGSEYAQDGAKWYKISFVHTDGKTYEGYGHSNYIEITSDIEYVPDGDFEAYMTNQGFPESYKPYLRILHTQYPKWVFVADKINVDFQTAVDNQYKTTSGSSYYMGRSLISINSISSYKSTDPKAYNWETGKWYGFDGGAWAAASRELVAYSLDPRNYLDKNTIFAFESMSYEPTYQTEEAVEKILAGTFMASTAATGKISDDKGGELTYAQALILAASISGASPFYLAASIRQEIGTLGTSGSISGVVAGYENLFNYYNIGAWATDTMSAIERGLWWASQSSTNEKYMRPWNSRYKAIIGGAIYTANNYIAIGQDTLYYKKFDFVEPYYTHQYMTHVIAAMKEGQSNAKGYTDEMRETYSLIFYIPVFNNMPDTACPIPTKTGSPNNVLKSITVSQSGITPSFDMFTHEYDVVVDGSVQEITIDATKVDSKAKITGTGTHALQFGNNKIVIKVTAENGDVRNYTLNVVRNGTSADFPLDYKIENVISNKEKQMITNVAVGTTAEQMLKNFTITNGSVRVVDANGVAKTGVLGTGDRVQILDYDKEVAYDYTIVIFGDVNGDGKITMLDVLRTQKHFMKLESLEGRYAVAADVTRTDGKVTMLDVLKIQKHFMKLDEIQQVLDFEIEQAKEQEEETTVVESETAGEQQTESESVAETESYLEAESYSEEEISLQEGTQTAVETETTTSADLS